MDRRIVHRVQVHEVFLTEVDEQDGSFLAQLPSTHAYFCDSESARHGLVDILTLMEACRQAATAAAHLFWGVPDDRQFVLTRWKASFPVATRPRYGVDPVDLRMGVTLERPQHMRDTLTGGTTRVTVSSPYDGEPLIGTLELDVRYVSKETYQFLRSGARGGAPLPTSITRLPERTAADPRDVGCTREDNVAIGPPAQRTGDARHCDFRSTTAACSTTPRTTRPRWSWSKRLVNSCTPPAPPHPQLMLCSPRSMATSAPTSNSTRPRCWLPVSVPTRNRMDRRRQTCRSLRIRMTPHR